MTTSMNSDNKTSRLKQNGDDTTTAAALDDDDDRKSYFSYADISRAVSATVPRVKAFNPDVIVAIGGGGFIPARMLRTEIKVPILAISLSLYDDNDNDKKVIQTVQWLEDENDGSSSSSSSIRGKRVLIVDEVDDTRTTLQHAIEELNRRNHPAAVGVMVVHNKLKPKIGILPKNVTAYIAGENIPGNAWSCYPWDAKKYGHDIDQHEKVALSKKQLAVRNGHSKGKNIDKRDRILSYYYCSAAAMAGFVSGIMITTALVVVKKKR